MLFLAMRGIGTPMIDKLAEELGLQPLHEPASAEAIDNYEKTNGFRFNDEYRSFLMRWNGLDFEAWQESSVWDHQHDEWDDALDEAWDALPEPEFELLDRIDGLPDMPTLGSEWHFYDQRLLRHGHPIGWDGFGNPCVQTSRSDGGRILMVDHERYYGGLDEVFRLAEMSPLERSAYPFDAVEHVDPSTFWKAVEEQGYVQFVAPIFAAFLKMHLKHHLAVARQLTPRFRKG